MNLGKAPGEGGGRHALSWLLTASLFLPYLAIPIGKNTNIPATSLLTICLLLASRPRLNILTPFVLIALAPVLTTSLVVLSGSSLYNLKALLIWPLHIIALAGMAVAVLMSPRTVHGALRVGLWLSVIIAGLQYRAILSGSVPFLDIYSLAGYADLTQREFELVTYIKRPFGQYPEPSFMAGSLALGLMMYLVLELKLNKRLTAPTHALILCVIFTIYLSQSGSGAVTIALILILVVWTARSWRLRPILLLVGAFAAALLGSVTIASRNSGGNNYSWSDRLTSIREPFSLMFEHTGAVFVGFGKGTIAELASAGQVLQQTSTFQGSTSDVASVLLRLIPELGLVIGAAVVVSLTSIVYRGIKVGLGQTEAVIYALCWVTVSALTLTYDSAAFIWAGAGLPLALLREVGDKREGNAYC